MENPKTIRLGDLKRELAWVFALSDDTEISFGIGDLSFNTAKVHLYRDDSKTPAIVNIRFNETYQVTFDPESAA